MKEREKYGSFFFFFFLSEISDYLVYTPTNVVTTAATNMKSWLFYVNIDMLTQSDNANVGPVCVCCKNWAQSAKPVQIFNEQFYITSLSFTQKLHVQYRTKEFLKPREQ